MSRYCPVCGKITDPMGWSSSAETCEECRDKIKGISTNYWEQLTLAETQNKRIRQLTFKRIEEDATNRGLQYMAELAYVYRQKCKNVTNNDIKIEYCDEYLSFMDRAKEKCTHNEYEYIEVYAGEIL